MNRPVNIILDGLVSILFLLTVGGSLWVMAVVSQGDGDLRDNREIGDGN